MRAGQTLPCLLICIAAVSAVRATERRTELGIQGKAFTIDGKPTFLLGCSYFAGSGALEQNVWTDLDDLQRYHFNWIRVWATWSAFDNDVSAVDADGQPRQPYLDKLRRLVAECDARGI